MLYRKQILAARAILEITQSDLSELSGVATVTIGKIEASEETFNKASSVTIRKLREAFIKQGIKFLAPSEEIEGIAGIGIRYFPIENKENNNLSYINWVYMVTLKSFQIYLIRYQFHN